MSKERKRSTAYRKTTISPRSGRDFRNVERGKRTLADMIADSQKRDAEKQKEGK